MYFVQGFRGFGLSWWEMHDTESRIVVWQNVEQSQEEAGQDTGPPRVRSTACSDFESISECMVFIQDVRFLII